MYIYIYIYIYIVYITYITVPTGNYVPKYLRVATKPFC